MAGTIPQFVDTTVLYANQLNRMVDVLNTIVNATSQSSLANYMTFSGAAAASPVIIGAAGSDTHIGYGILPKGNYGTTTTRMFVVDQVNWAATQTANASRLMTQLSAFKTSYTNATATEMYPQFSVGMGTLSGTVNTGVRAWYNTITVTNDNLIANAGTGPQGMSLMYFGLGVGNANGTAGSPHQGGRNAIDAEIFINSNVDIGPGSLFHVGVAGGTTAYYKMGGIPGGHRGNIFGGNIWARAYNVDAFVGPRYLNSIVGLEFGVRQEANVSALWKIGAQIVEENSSAANAIQQNIGLGIVNQPSATTIGYDQGIVFSAYNGQFSINSNGQLISTLPTPIGLSPFECADGVNLTRLAISRAAFNSTGIFLGGDGNIGATGIGGTSVQTMGAINGRTASVVNTTGITILDGGVYDGQATVSTTGTFLSADTAVTVASFTGISNGMTVSGTGIQTGTTLVSGAGTVNFVLSLPTTAPGTGTALLFTPVHVFPTFDIAAPPIPGVTATMTVTNMGAIAFSGIDNIGTLYAAGQTLEAQGGTFTTPFTVYIETIGSNGTVANVRIIDPGDYTVRPANPVRFSNGGGSGIDFAANIRWTILDTSNTAGSGYNEFLPPEVTKTGAVIATKEARFKLTMVGTDTDITLNNNFLIDVNGSVDIASGIVIIDAGTGDAHFDGTIDGNIVEAPVLRNSAAGPTIRSGTGAASGTQPQGSIWLRTDGGVGTTVYVTQGGGTWNPVAGV